MQFLIESTLYSYAQIFFSNRKWFGGVALAATFVSPLFGFAALLGVILSNLIAYWLKFDTFKIRSGFYGFNGILFGLAVIYYFKVDFQILMFLIIFIAITFLVSAVLENYLAIGFNLPGLSLPFIITLYIFLIFLTNYNSIAPNLHASGDPEILNQLPYAIKAYFKSVALILFQPNILSGIILVAGILFFSRILFILSILGFAANYFFLSFILPQYSQSLLILTGFNSILTAFALGGALILPSRKSFLLVVVSSIGVVILTGFFIRVFGQSILPILVLPFNFIVLSTIYMLKFRKDQTDLVLLYFSPGSPEENLYFHNNKRARFDKFKYVYPELPFFGEWYVNQGISGEYTHKDDWKYAWDFVVVDEKNKQYDNDGYAATDYYCYRLPVAAPLDGEVVLVTASIPNNKIGDVNVAKNWGNTVILKHEYGLYSSVSHLEPNSIKVKEGEKVLKGDLIALCGNSGRSPYPHIHFQFQISEKLGDKTHLFPFAHFIEKHEGSLYLRTFDYPKAGTVIQNLDTHKALKKAFDFKIGDEMRFEYEYKGKLLTETWTIKIDMYNSYYIESSTGDIAYFYVTNKIFFINSYTGSKKSALYFFYLSALQVPTSYHKDLRWSDIYSIAQVSNSFVRYISEFLLMIREYIKAEVEFSFEEQPEGKKDFVISSNIKIKGSSIFSFFEQSNEGKLTVDSEGNIKEISFMKLRGSDSLTDGKDKEIIFRATRVLEKD